MSLSQPWMAVFSEIFSLLFPTYCFYKLASPDITVTPQLHKDFVSWAEFQSCQRSLLETGLWICIQIRVQLFSLVRIRIQSLSLVNRIQLKHFCKKLIYEEFAVVEIIKRDCLKVKKTLSRSKFT